MPRSEVQLNSVWKVKDRKDPNVTHTVDVTIDEELLEQAVRRVAVRAAGTTKGTAIHNHGMIAGKRRKS